MLSSGHIQNTMIKYKGFIWHFAFDEEKLMFFGKVANSHDFITFQGKSLSEIEFAFHDAVNDYIDWCQRFRKEKPKSP